MSSYVHYQLLTDASYTSFLRRQRDGQLHAGLSEPYGSFWGVPVALGGVMFFAMVLVHRRRGRAAGLQVARERPGYVFALSTLALAFVLYLGWASYFVLKMFCILCAITYVAVIAIFIISGGATTFPMTTLPIAHAATFGRSCRAPRAAHRGRSSSPGGHRRRRVPARSARRAAPRRRRPRRCQQVTDEERAQIAQWWDVQPKVEVPVPADGAKVLIVKFNDYQCPACKLTFDSYKHDPGEVRRQRAGEVRRQALSARAGVQSKCPERQPLRLVRGGRGGHHGEGARARPISWKTGSSRTSVRRS